jgi:hypothetical protein
LPGRGPATSNASSTRPPSDAINSPRINEIIPKVVSSSSRALD